MSEKVAELEKLLDSSSSELSKSKQLATDLEREIKVQNLDMTSRLNSQCDRYEELNAKYQNKCESECKVIMEFRDLQVSYKEVTEEMENKVADLIEAQLALNERDSEIEDLRSQFSSQILVNDDLASELTKQKELLLYISKISQRNSTTDASE